MLYEWSPGEDARNLGDALPVLLIPEPILSTLGKSEDYMFCPIGSVITDAVIEHARWLKKTPVFLGCGWDGSPLSKRLLEESLFFGCRGPLTQFELGRHGIHVGVTGDPGYGLLDCVERGAKNGLKILVPHVADPDTGDFPDTHGVDRVVRPTASDSDGLRGLIQLISGADFVLTGSLHAAIIAHGYGVRFALYRSSLDGYLDHPTKWSDWLDSVSTRQPQFFNHVDAGEEWYAQFVQEQCLPLNFGLDSYQSLLRQAVLVAGTDELTGQDEGSGTVTRERSALPGEEPGGDGEAGGERPIDDKAGATFEGDEVWRARATAYLEARDFWRSQAQSKRAALRHLLPFGRR